jgi:hypothetical protein
MPFLLCNLCIHQHASHPSPPSTSGPSNAPHRPDLRPVISTLRRISRQHQINRPWRNKRIPFSSIRFGDAHMMSCVCDARLRSTLQGVGRPKNKIPCASPPVRSTVTRSLSKTDAVMPEIRYCYFYGMSYHKTKCICGPKQPLTVTSGPGVLVCVGGWVSKYTWCVAQHEHHPHVQPRAWRHGTAAAAW